MFKKIALAALVAASLSGPALAAGGGCVVAALRRGTAVVASPPTP